MMMMVMMMKKAMKIMMIVTNLLTIMGTGSARIKTDSRAAKPPISCMKIRSNGFFFSS